MSTRRKILLPLAVVALGATGIGVVGGPTLFAGASLTPTFPVACKITATVTFTPPLSMSGTIGTSRSAVTTMSVTAAKWTGCLSAASATAPGHGDVVTQTVSLPATKLGAGRYATGYCPLFTPTNVLGTLKAFKGLVFDVVWTGGAGGASVFTTSKVTTMTNVDGELGLVFAGKQGGGSYTEKDLNQISEFFDATTSAALTTGCTANQTVTTATFDVTNSVGIL